jgi:hypothetical protein
MYKYTYKYAIIMYNIHWSVHLSALCYARNCTLYQRFCKYDYIMLSIVDCSMVMMYIYYVDLCEDSWIAKWDNIDMVT